MDAALAEFRLAIERKPNFSAAWLQLAITLVELGRDVEAIAVYEVAVYRVSAVFFKTILGITVPHGAYCFCFVYLPTSTLPMSSRLETLAVIPTCPCQTINESQASMPLVPREFYFGLMLISSRGYKFYHRLAVLKINRPHKQTDRANNRYRGCNRRFPTQAYP